MDEAKRFIRFIIPGLIFTFQVITFIILSEPKTFLDPDSLKSNLDLGSAVFLLASSGVLGYIFSMFYYSVHWYIISKKIFGLDYKTIVTKYQSKFEERFEKVSPNNQIEAWEYINVYWAYDEGVGLDKMERMAMVLSNIVHSMGIGIIAILFGVITTISILIFKHYDLSYIVLIVYFALVALVLAVFIYQYYKVFRQLLGLYDKALACTQTKVKTPDA